MSLAACSSTTWRTDACTNHTVDIRKNKSGFHRVKMPFLNAGEMW